MEDKDLNLLKATVLRTASLVGSFSGDIDSLNKRVDGFSGGISSLNQAVIDLDTEVKRVDNAVSAAATTADGAASVADSAITLANSNEERIAKLEEGGSGSGGGLYRHAITMQHTAKPTTSSPELFDVYLCVYSKRESPFTFNELCAELKGANHFPVTGFVGMAATSLIISARFDTDLMSFLYIPFSGGTYNFQDVRESDLSSYPQLSGDFIDKVFKL